MQHSTAHASPTLLMFVTLNCLLQTSGRDSPHPQPLVCKAISFPGATFLMPQLRGCHCVWPGDHGAAAGRSALGRVHQSKLIMLSAITRLCLAVPTRGVSIAQ
eukprot:scaffold70768_cov17-Tisochrysis_lutea.AAC.1